jgi:hypothetical protein
LCQKSCEIRSWQEQHFPLILFIIATVAKKILKMKNVLDSALNADFQPNNSDIYAYQTGLIE